MDRRYNKKLVNFFKQLILLENNCDGDCLRNKLFSFLNIYAELKFDLPAEGFLV
jgi:hypothetical protein